MIDHTPPDVRAAYTLQLAELDDFFAQECYLKTVGFFPTQRVWVCPYCESTIPDAGLPSPTDMLHHQGCAWAEALCEWPKELVEFYMAAWMQRNPMSKRIIRTACPIPQTPNPSES